MENWVDLLARTYEVARVPMAHLDATGLDRPTPCSEWVVRDLVEHTIGTIDKFASAAGASSAQPAVERAAERTPIERFDAAVVRSLSTWAAFTDWSATLTVPFGEFPAQVAVGINQLDVLVHSWDIGSSLGVPVTLPDDLSEVAMRLAKVRVPLGRGRVFGNESIAHGTGPGEKLLAFTGRNTAAWPAAVRT